jgi:hypothetical protein
VPGVQYNTCFSCPNLCQGGIKSRRSGHRQALPLVSLPTGRVVRTHFQRGFCCTRAMNPGHKWIQAERIFIVFGARFTPRWTVGLHACQSHTDNSLGPVQWTAGNPEYPLGIFVQEAPHSYITSLCELDGTYGAPFNPNTDPSHLRLRRSMLVIFFSQECLHLEC